MSGRQWQLWARRGVRAGCIATACSMASFVHSGEISRWVDAEGNVHFGNPQFAPAGDGKRVKVAPANGMVAPDLSPLQTRTGGSGGRMVRLPHNNQNAYAESWRGHQQRGRGGRYGN